MVYLAISGSSLHCRSDSTDPGWSIQIGEIVLVAEYTTDDGPAVDDYFLVFVTREYGELFYSSVTMSAAGINSVMEDLEKHLGGTLELKLFSTRRRESRVVWPRHLAGVEYLEPEEIAPPSGLREQLLRMFRGVRPTYRVSERIVQALTTTGPVVK